MSLEDIPFAHVYREFNIMADHIINKAVSLEQGTQRTRAQRKVSSIKFKSCFGLNERANFKPLGNFCIIWQILLMCAVTGLFGSRTRVS